MLIFCFFIYSNNIYYFQTVSSFSSFKLHILMLLGFFFFKLHSFHKEHFILTWRTDLLIILMAFILKIKARTNRIFNVDISAARKVICLIYIQTCRYFRICRKQVYKSYKTIYFCIRQHESEKTNTLISFSWRNWLYFLTCLPLSDKYLLLKKGKKS